MRDLTRGTVTAASRVMLPTYAVFFTITGCSLILTSTARLRETPALRYADTVFPIHAWGLLILAMGAALAVALIRRRRTWYTYVLGGAATWMSLFSLATFTAIFKDRAPLGGWAWPGFVAVACIASLRSISTGETGEPR